MLALDLNLPGGSSMDALPRLREKSPDTAIVVLIMQDDPGYAEYALQTGALGFVLKEDGEDELLLAIRLAAVGDTYLNPRLAQASPPGGGGRETTGPDGRTRG